MVNLWVWTFFLVPISVTLGQGHQAAEAGQILHCPHDKVRTATKRGRYTPLVMLSTWSNFGGILSETFSSTVFLRKISNACFPNRTFYLTYPRIGWSNWCGTKRKWVNWMLCWLGYLWPWHLTLTFDLEFSRSSGILGMVRPIVMERKGRRSIGCPDMKHKGNMSTGCCADWGTLTLTFHLECSRPNSRVTLYIAGQLAHSPAT